jgi:hypothetical protein
MIENTTFPEFIGAIVAIAIITNVILLWWIG